MSSPVLSLLGHRLTITHDAIIANLLEVARDYMKRFSIYEMNDLNNFFALQLHLMREIQTMDKPRLVSLSGTEKAVLTTHVIFVIAQDLYKEYTAEMDDIEIEELKTGRLKYIVLILEHPDIFISTTSYLKLLLNRLDSNNDGRISKDELKNFWCCKK